MHSAVLFAEDFGHEAFLDALLRRIAHERGVALGIRVVLARGGHGGVKTGLRRFVGDMSRGAEPLPDLLVVARDANCEGYAARKREVEELCGPVADRLVCAIPDPHVERWLLVDSAAFKAVLGRGCVAPDHKCDKDRYKEQLGRAIRDAGLQPLIGGFEHAEEIVQAMDLRPRHQMDASLGHLVQALNNAFRRLAGG